MIRTADMPTPADPQLIDVALVELQAVLLDGLSWLSKAYGKAERRVREVDSRSRYYPAAYVHTKDYVSLLPDEHIGNFVWFDVEDSQEVDYVPRGWSELRSRAGLVFWFDYRTIYPNDYHTRTIENVKSEVLRLLTTTTLQNSTLTVQSFDERAESVYRSYSIDEVKNQLLMRPYGAFRLNALLRYREKCEP